MYRKKLHKIFCFVLCIMMCMVLFACGGDVVESYENYEEETSENSELFSAATDEAGEVDSLSQICVYICGSVNNPGVYTFLAGDRVCKAIEVAGGFSGDANTSFWNQAQEMTDGMMIYVPSIDENVESDSEIAVASDGRININTASKEELMTISGIGESRALSIIQYREEHGGFSSIEDIMQVSGIGNSLFEKMREYITVN